MTLHLRHLKNARNDALKPIRDKTNAELRAAVEGEGEDKSRRRRIKRRKGYWLSALAITLTVTFGYKH